MQPDTNERKLGNLKILAVQTDEWTLKGLVQLLDPFGAQLLMASGPEEAALLYSADKAPDVVLLSGLHDKKRMEGHAQAIRARFPQAQVFVMAGQAPDERSVQIALRAGVSGLILKDMTGEQLIAAFHQALAGLTVLPLRVAYSLISPGTTPHVSMRRNGPLPENLSPKEWQILEQLVLGLTNKEIAQEFDIAEGTVKVHLRSILQKTKKRNRTEAALWALNVMQQPAERHPL